MTSKEPSGGELFTYYPIPHCADELRLFSGCSSLVTRHCLQPRLDLLAQVESHAELRLNLPGPVHEQHGWEVLDLEAPPEFLSGRAAEIHMEKLDFVSPLSFEPMHDGPGRLAAESEVRVEMQEADLSGTQPIGKIVQGSKRRRLLLSPDGDSPDQGQKGNQRGPRRPGSREAAQYPGGQDKPDAGSEEQRMPRDESVNRVNGSSSLLIDSPTLSFRSRLAGRGICLFFLSQDDVQVPHPLRGIGMTATNVIQ